MKGDAKHLVGGQRALVHLLVGAKVERDGIFVDGDDGGQQEIPAFVEMDSDTIDRRLQTA